jgi:hypothetical protein
MSEAAFPPGVAAALDRLTVPALPDGFADRLIGRIAADDLPAEMALPLPAKPRLSVMRRSGWRRTGGIFASVAAVGLATATAAASGAFGEPVYVPVVSDALARVDLVELPKKPKPVAKTAPKAAPTVESPKKPEPVVDGKSTASDLIRSKWQDPNFQQLPREQRQMAMQAEIRAAIEAGRFTREEFRAALAEAQAERRAKNEEQAKQRLPTREEIARKQRERAAAIRQRYENATPQEQSVMREQYRTATKLQMQLRDLRLKLRDADPIDQPAIREEMRTLRRELSKLKAENEARLNEGNAAPVR